MTRIRTKFMHIRQKNPKYTTIRVVFYGHLGIGFMLSKKNSSVLKKNKYTSDFFALLLFVLNNLPPPILLFGTILLLNLTDLLPYTVIWPIRLFGTREY